MIWHYSFIGLNHLSIENKLKSTYKTKGSIFTQADTISYFKCWWKWKMAIRIHLLQQKRKPNSYMLNLKPNSTRYKTSDRTRKSEETKKALQIHSSNRNKAGMAEYSIRNQRTREVACRMSSIVIGWSDSRKSPDGNRANGFRPKSMTTSIKSWSSGCSLTLRRISSGKSASSRPSSTSKSSALPVASWDGNSGADEFRRGETLRFRAAMPGQENVRVVGKWKRIRVVVYRVGEGLKGRCRGCGREWESSIGVLAVKSAWDLGAVRFWNSGNFVFFFFLFVQLIRVVCGWIKLNDAAYFLKIFF